MLDTLLHAWDVVAAGTVFMPVTAIDASIEALALPASVDVVKFLLTLLLAMPLGFASRLVPPGAPRHVYNLLLGVAYAQACYGPGWLHLPASAAVAYVILRLSPRRQCGLLVFVWMMAYVGGMHVYRLWTDWLGYTMDFSGPQMMATIKLTSLGFNYSDGRSRSAGERAQDEAAVTEQIQQLADRAKGGDREGKEGKADKAALSELRTRQLQLGLSVDNLPSPLVYMAWVQNFSTYQAGPALEYQEYMAVNNGSLALLPPGCAAAAARQFVLGVVCLFGHVVLDGSFPFGDPALGTADTRGILSDSFLRRGIFSRLGYVVASVLGVQLRYFMAWKLGEAAATAFGYGSAGGLWNGCQNIDLRAWLLADSMNMAAKAWNQKTQAWLETYTYRRYPGGRGAKLLATYAVSAYWHGFYPGYYLTFFNLGLLNMGQDVLKAHVRPYFCVSPGDEKATTIFQSFSRPCSRTKRGYDLIGLLGMIWIKSFVVMPFLFCTVSNGRDSTSRLYFLGPAFTLIGLLLVPRVPKKRKEASKER